jgi:hypothetical protein
MLTCQNRELSNQQFLVRQKQNKQKDQRTNHTASKNNN